MYRQKKQLTAEEAPRVGSKIQKKNEKNKQAVTQTKVERMATRLRFNSTESTPNQTSTNKNNAGQTPKQVEWEVEDALAGWPWVGVPAKLLTQAPYALNEHNVETGFFKLPQEVQTSPLFNIPRGMEQPILRILFEYHRCAGKFAATCQAAFNLVASSIDHWDFSRGGFNGCDKKADDKAHHPTSVGKIVVVSQFRVRKWRGENYKCDMYSLQNMTHAFVNFADRFEVLHLHRIPLLTIHLLAMVIPLMVNLKVLGIYRCELIHLGDTMRLLEIIRLGRSDGKDDKLSLDFYPRFHVGPVHVPGGNEQTGSYGVTWDNFGLDSRLAIWQLLTRILPQAKRQGANLIGKDSAFRFWLEQSPCWRVSDTIAAIERGDDGRKLAVQVDYPNTRGKSTRFNKNGIWVLEKFYCRMCMEDVLGIFYDYEEFTQHEWFCAPQYSYTMLCLGCKLTMHLNFETDHRKAYKHDMVKGWLGDPNVPINAGDLEKALHEKSKRRGMAVAARCDDDRKRREATNPGPERQMPYVKGRKYSPNIYDIEQHGYW